MFLVTNFYFRHYEFLCSSLSFFESVASIPRIERRHLGMVKIVSVSLPMFTCKNGVESKYFHNFITQIGICLYPPKRHMLLKMLSYVSFFGDVLMFFEKLTYDNLVI